MCDWQFLSFNNYSIFSILFKILLQTGDIDNQHYEHNKNIMNKTLYLISYKRDR